MDKKRFGGPLEFKADGPPGSFVATFASLNVVDHDGDVTVPGAFKDGQAVRIAQFGHNWSAPPIGAGVIHADQERAWVEGQFFLGMPEAQSTYESVKGLGGLAEWSYGYDVLDAAPGEFQGEQVRYLRGLEVHEVSPVMLGAGIGTRTETIKGSSWGADGVPVGTEPEPDGLKPYPNEHACRLQDPGKFDRFRRGKRKHDGKDYSIIFGHPKDGGGWEEQAYRYPKDTWTAEQARSHCKDHDGGTFEAASDGKADDAETKQAVPGSFEERSELLNAALQQRYGSDGGTGIPMRYVYPVATFADRAVVCIMADGTEEYREVEYTLADGSVSLGAERQVDLETTIVPKGLDFPDHSERVRVAVLGYVGRVQAGSALRAKEGRAISDSRRQRMAAVRDQLRSGADEIDGLLQETEPKPKGADPAALRAEFVRYQRQRAHLVGV